jgi:flavin-dependent dehydrogenase
MFDVAVIGGGPAGAAAALSLAAEGRSVILIGRSHRSGFRAGEVLGPEIAPLLVQLGVWESFLASGPQPAHGIWSAWGGRNLVAKDFVVSPYGPAWRVDRARFDEMLLTAAAKAGSRVALRFRRVTVRRNAGGWRINAEGSTEALTVDSRFVVDATGRAAAVARANGARWLGRDRLVALVGLLAKRTDTTASADDVLLVESAPIGWWYSTVLPSGDLVAALLTDADLVRDHSRAAAGAWCDALVSAEFTALRAAGFTHSAFHVRPAGVGCLDRAAGVGWIAVGDAASTMDPLSGIGIAKGLQSAILGAGAISDALSGMQGGLDIHARRSREEFEASQRTGAAYYDLERRWSECPFWRRRQSRAFEGGTPWQPAIDPKATLST